MICLDASIRGNEFQEIKLEEAFAIVVIGMRDYIELTITGFPPAWEYAYETIPRPSKTCA